VKTILLTGKDGQVGWELQRTLAPLGKVIALDRQALDLANADAIRAAIRDTHPDIIVNAAAYTAVDQAEKESAAAMAINGIAPGILAEEARRSGAWLVHYSTDYVFDGTKNAAYGEGDATNPLNAYGRSKLAGEQAIQAVGGSYTIFRTSWVYGLRGKNFLRTILRLAQEKEELRIVADQIGAPTWSRMIAEATSAILARENQVQGLFHLTSSGETSWHGFTQAILELTRELHPRDPVLSAIPGSEYPLPAARPNNSRLSCKLLARETAIQLPDWHAALTLCLAQ
jgi:dTDP-4-dehydrorhamnose reductase